ncbi:MAG: YfhO family protein [Bacteroidales bacterium]|nr:YfhO family protein [Bacteroidales bacterium]
MKSKETLKKYIPYIFSIVVFLCIALIYCKPVLSGKVIMQGDIKNWEGMVQEMRSWNTAHPETPTNWTNSMFSGMPGYQIGGGTPTDGVSKPINKLFSFFYNATHLFFSSPISIIIGYFIGFFILLLAFGVNVWISLIGSIAITFSTYFMLIIPAGHETKAYALGSLAPVIGGFYLIFRKNKYLLGMALTMLFSAIGALSHPQMTYYLFLMAALFGIAETFLHIKGKRIRQLFISLGCFAVALAIGLGANYSKIVSNSEYVKETMRGGHSDLSSESTTGSTGKTSGLSLEYATQWSYGIDETMTLLIPNYMGGSSNYNLGTNSKMYKELVKQRVAPAQARDLSASFPTYWGDQPFTAGPVYVGAIVLFLFILALMVVQGAYKWAILASVIFSVLLSWGYHFMPLTKLFFNYFPYYNKFRTVSSILVVAEVAIPLLAFIGLNDIISGKVEKGKLKKGIKIAALSVGGVALFFALLGGAICSFTSRYDAANFGQLPDWFIGIIHDQRKAMLTSDAWRSFAFVAAGAATLWFMASEKLKKEYAIAILGILIVADLYPVNRRFFNDDNFVSKQSDKNYFAIQPYEEQILQDKDPYFRVFNLTSNTFNDSRTSYRLKSLGGYHAAKLRRYQDIIDRHLSGNNISPNVVNMLNAKYIIFPDENGQPTPQLNPDHFGNAWFVDKVEIAESADIECEALREMDLKKIAITDKSFAAFVSSTETPADSSASIVLTSYAPDILEYKTSCKYDKTAIFSDIYYPYGWKAYIDGKPTEHFRANYLLRAINIPAGEHEVRFEFRPDSIYKGYRVNSACKAIAILFIIGSISTIFIRKKKED